MKKTFWISIVSSLIICAIYVIATYRFEIPFCYTIMVGVIMFTLIFFVLDVLEI